MGRSAYAAAARDAFAWIGSQQVRFDAGSAWNEHDELVDDLYAGTAGVLLACAEAKRAGLEEAGLDELATAARDRLDHLSRTGQPLAGPEADNALFTGWAGAAVASYAWARVAGDEGARRCADRIIATLAGQVVAGVDNPSRYTDVISGDAGILLALMDGDPAVTRTAVGAVVDRLLAVTEAGRTGPQWRMVDHWGYIMPGFSHGTAGVAYALALAGSWLEREDLLDIAVEAADGLIELGSAADGTWALPVTVPRPDDGPGVNFGWCHGPAGTARLFVLLAELQPRTRWTDAVAACDQALRDSRIPARLYPGYWDNLARCCGTAGVGQYLLDRHARTGDRAFAEWAQVLADDVVARAVPQAVGRAWSNTEHKNEDPELPPDVGLMQGAAGIAGWLARLDRAVDGASFARSPEWV